MNKESNLLLRINAIQSQEDRQKMGIIHYGRIWATVFPCRLQHQGMWRVANKVTREVSWDQCTRLESPVNRLA